MVAAGPAADPMPAVPEGAQVLGEGAHGLGGPGPSISMSEKEVVETMFKEDNVVDEQGRKVLKPAAHKRRQRIQDLESTAWSMAADPEDLEEPEGEEGESSEVHFTCLIPGPDYGVEVSIVDLPLKNNQEASSSMSDPSDPVQDD